MLRLTYGAVLAVGLLGCGGDEANLILNLRTDLLPGVEFSAVQVERFAGIPRAEEAAHGSARTVVPATQAQDFVEGERVAQFVGVKPGTYAVRVRLLGPDGEPFLQRILLVTLSQTATFTALLTRDCRNVLCPASGDGTDATECLNKKCTRPECTPETPEACGDLSCTVGATCTVAAPCAIAQCTADQICLRTEGTGCGASQYCDPDLGCQPLPETADAGTRDSGSVDSGPLDSGMPDSSADASTPVELPVALQAYIKASNTDSFDDRFGTSVAASADGSTIAVGAPYEWGGATGVDGNQADNSKEASGAVYVFTRSGTTWSQQAYLKASNTGDRDQFGNALALSADGSRLAVGAFFEDSAATGVNGDGTDNTGFDSGAVYVFTRSGTSWSQEAYLKASNAEAGDRFGTAVALSADGTMLAVGATYEDSSAVSVDGDQADNTAAEAGAVYVFTRSGTIWSQQAYLKASNAESGDQLGNAVAFSADASTLAIAAAFEASAATGVNGDQADNSAIRSGAVYVFTRSGTIWSQQAYLKASNAGMHDLFGASLGLATDGDTLVVGANWEDSAATGVNGDEADDAAFDSGAAYVFTRNGAAWSQQAYLKASNTGANDGFAASVSVTGNGSALAVGARLEDSMATGLNGDEMDNSASSSGAVYLFTRNGSTWSQQAYLKASNADRGDAFGHAALLASDGRTLTVGAIGEASAARGIDGNQADNAAPASGAVYVYTF